jgi:hypothetical protein
MWFTHAECINHDACEINTKLTRKSTKKIQTGFWLVALPHAWVCVWFEHIMSLLFLFSYDTLVASIDVDQHAAWLFICTVFTTMCVKSHAKFFLFRHALRYIYRVNTKNLTVYYKYSMDKNFTDYSIKFKFCSFYAAVEAYFFSFNSVVANHILYTA